MKRVIIMGSPRSNGRCAHLAETLFEANIDEHPEDELFLVPISEIEVGPCIGCNGCRKQSNVIFRDDEGNEVVEQRHRCIFDDDMQGVYDMLDDADELVIVSPVYFSGAPAPMKCALDRLQPYFWADARKAPKRPGVLHVVGEGGDPHGYDALVSEVRSATAVAGFRLERVLDWVGKISTEGEILADAEEVELPALGTARSPIAAVDSQEVDGAEEAFVDASSGKPADGRTAEKKPAGAKPANGKPSGTRPAGGKPSGGKPRPKLKLSQDEKPRASGGKQTQAQRKKTTSNPNSTTKRAAETNKKRTSDSGRKRNPNANKGRGGRGGR